MAISIEEIRKIAVLARLKLTPSEEARHAETVSAVLDYMKILNEVDTTEVEETAQVTGLKNVTREDKPRSAENKKELLAQMPEMEKDELVVPGVFEA